MIDATRLLETFTSRVEVRWRGSLECLDSTAGQYLQCRNICRAHQVFFGSKVGAIVMNALRMISASRMIEIGACTLYLSH